ncbi:C6 transcription factor [Pseudozyma hubeiensis]|nr:C6 transcription factor [Pseudozyma hubeiensis]
MASSAMMAAAETLASVASAGPSSPAKERASSKSQSRKSDAVAADSEPKKRTRPVSACEACRAKKVRCLLSPDAPVCQNCLASGKQCLFRVDDLAPALRAARFAHCGPPSANARTIASKKASNSTPRKSHHDADESSRPKPPKRKKSDAESEASDAKDNTQDAAAASTSKPKAKAVFRSFANPNKLAAPLPIPTTPTFIKRASSPPSIMASPPSKGAHAHFSRMSSSTSSTSRRRSDSASTRDDFFDRDSGIPASSKHRFSHPTTGDQHGAYLEAFAQSHDPSHYGHAVDVAPVSGPGSAGGASFFLQQQSPSDSSVFSNRSGRSTTMYAAPRPFNPPPTDDFRSRRKTSAASPPKVLNQPVDPMSLEYYGHPSDPSSVHKHEAPYKPSFDHRTSSNVAETSRRDVSAELRDGIEEWQRKGAAKPDDELEVTTKVQEEPIPQSRPKIVLPFFRWFGTTANTPGYRKIKVGVLQDSEVPGTDELAPALSADDDAPENAASFGFTVRDDDQHLSLTPGKMLDESVLSPHPAQLASPGARFENKASSSVTRELFEINRPRYPRKDILEHLVTLFLTHFKPSWCPWMEADELKNGVENGSMPAILANAVCAVAARFSNRPELRKAPRKSSGDPFSEMAKILIIPLLSFPSIEVIEALILLSYSEFAAGSDSGLWMYVGMALRMAQDLGLQHEVSIQSIPNEKHQEKARLLFWAVIGLDRITTFGTGRPVSIRESEIDIELPKLGESSDMKDETVVFGHVVRILMLRGRMGELLNRREREESSVSAETTKRDLTRMWFELAQSYSDLPANLHFNVQTFQKSAAHNQSPGFVYLHVLFQSTIGLLDRPALMKKFTGDSVPLLPSFAPAASASASRTIADILTLGDAFDDRSITASPYLDQLVLPAGRSFVAERQAAREALRSMGHGTTPAPSRPPSRGAAPNHQQSRTSHLVSTKSYAEINLGACQRILQKLQQYWAGASWPLRALEQEAAGNGGEIDPQASDEDAQSAPIRDIEMVLKWAKSRIRSKKRLARSLQATPKPETMTLSESMEGMNGIMTGGTGSDEFASTHSGDSPFGLGISAGLTFDIDALMGSWQMDEFDALGGVGAGVASEQGGVVGDQQGNGHTPYPATAGFAAGQIYSPGATRRSSLSTHLPPPLHSRSTSLHAPPHHLAPTTSLSALTTYHPPTPGTLDTSSLAIAEFFSHDQSVWPLSIQNDDIDQEAVNLIASAMQLPSYGAGSGGMM